MNLFNIICVHVSHFVFFSLVAISFRILTDADEIFNTSILEFS